MAKRLVNIIESMLLLEYNSDLTWKQHGAKIVNAADFHYGNNDSHPVMQAINADVNHTIPKDFINSGKLITDHPNFHEAVKKHLFPHLEATDPTPNKKYVQHVARMYGNGGLLNIEDLHSRIRPALSRYHELATRKQLAPEDRDIGKMKHFDDLEDIVDKYHNDAPSGKDEQRAHHKEMKNQATITDHPEFTHIIPHTEEASKHFGKGTRWCTAGNSSNMFDHYNSQGPLHIMSPKNPSYPGEKYQYHMSSKSLMDEKDKPVKEHEAPHYVNKFVNDYEAHENSVTDVNKTKEKGTVERIVHGISDPAHLETFLHHENPKVTHAVLTSPHITDGIIDKAVSHPDPKTRNEAARRIGPEGINKILDRNDEGLKSTVLYQNQNVDDNHVRKALKDKSSHIREIAAQHEMIHEDDLEWAANHEDHRMRAAAARNPYADEFGHMDYLAHDKHPDVRYAVVDSGYAHAGIISGGLHDEDEHVRKAAMEHDRFEPEDHIDDMIHSIYPDVRNKAIQHHAEFIDNKDLHKIHQDKNEHPDNRKSAKAELKSRGLLKND